MVDSKAKFVKRGGKWIVERVEVKVEKVYNNGVSDSKSCYTIRQVSRFRGGNLYKHFSEERRKYSTIHENNPEEKRSYSDDRLVKKEEWVNHFEKYSPKYTSNFMMHLMDKLYIDYKTNDILVNQDIQRKIELMIMDEYEVFFKNNKVLHLQGNIDVEKLVPKLIKFIMNKEDLLRSYIRNLKSSYETIKTTRDDKLFIRHVLQVVDEDFILNVCLTHFLLVYTHQNTENDKYYNLLTVSIEIGKKLLNRYFNLLRDKYIQENKIQITYSSWLKQWALDYDKFNDAMDESFRSVLGCHIIDILDNTEMLNKVLTKLAFDKSMYILEVRDNDFISKKENILTLPSKLPMIVPPKPYSDNVLGGYLLNDDRFSEELFIDKKGYNIRSVLNNNKIYDMVNKINSTPFRINNTLLEFILENGDKFGLLLDNTVKHKFAGLDKRTRYQEQVLKSHNSKVMLQDNVIWIAQFFEKFPEIYFPVRLDQRGRVYCSPNYLNYQSNELSKALLLFANPGIISKDNLRSTNYLKVYGGNCYGGRIGKSSTDRKLQWVDENIDNIVNYDNGILLNKAKDKLLFLAFCIEFKRFYNFYIDENQMEFKTYLPIQLDATCNGFQHMSLLSNEHTLFKELNLIDTKSNEPPKDFYNFLLHKLIHLFEIKINKGELIDSKYKGSYVRLSKFVWDRSYVKKAIMTIPYNSSRRSMKKYLVDSLVKMDYDEDKCSWYSDSLNNKVNMINDKDISLLIHSLMHIIENDFRKIRKLIKYLNNIASLYNLLGLPITWTLPSGLTISQSYLQKKSTTITPFMYSKLKLTLTINIKDKYDKNKQTRALMPNLIHSLDASSLSLLFEKFSNLHNNYVQFFSVHDCFGTTCEKVFSLKTILASVYTDIYSSDPYLLKFDKDVLDYIEKYTDYRVDRVNRTIVVEDKTFTIHDIDWVLNKKMISSNIINKIDSQYIVI